MVMGREWWRCVIGERKCRLLDAQVVMGCEWWRCVIGECNCRLLDGWCDG